MRFTLCILFLSGCASWGHHAREAQKRADRLERENRELKARLAKHSAPSPQPSPIKEEGRPKGAPSAPAAPPPPPPTASVALPWPYPDQGTGFLGRTPDGWGASPLSVLIKNVATREVPGFLDRQSYCFLGVEIDEQPAIIVRPDLNTGAVPMLCNVKEGPVIRTAALIPPGKSVYVILDKPGVHSFRFRCYVGPPKPTQVSGKIVPVIQLYEELLEDRTNPSVITVDHWGLRPVVGVTH